MTNTGLVGKHSGRSAQDKAAEVWTIQSGVFPEDTVSSRLRERAGFRVVGTRERVGCHHGQRRNTVLIERRSTVTGVS